METGVIRGFAEPADRVVAHERRWDLLREAKWSLEEWDRHRRPEDAQRCYRALRELAHLLQLAAST